MKKAAVILCGSGFKDGSEIRESVGVLWALSAANVAVDIFALDEAQRDVVNCLTGKQQANEQRNQLVEAARIARGDIKPLNQLDSTHYDCLILPGGFGAAKNWCDYALVGLQGKVHPLIQKVLQQFHQSNKPIGAVCIAPMIVAMAFPKMGLELTLGAAGGAAKDLEHLGHKHVVKKASEYLVDSKNKIFTTPAYMYDEAKLHEVFAGIQGMVQAIVQSLSH